ncbi:hypothetical protein CH352_00770 [Leptospira hartskeerlii]|uniref:DUF1554 domain-containing protein n=2 Tax=Leptospira hartskeerlii TaxID=2023177 RepID=A0A2M9X9B8_9LEPT|nr:hypothetical protein CH357_17875 [Leptospira hartskeerlii]PJZ35202.1 hypothetical protein CH352_00770 [Leptospira hartskeerlii]
MDSSKPIGMVLDLNFSEILAGTNGGSGTMEIEYDSTQTVGESIVSDISLNLSAFYGSDPVIYNFSIISGPSSAVLQTSSISFSNTSTKILSIEREPDEDCLEEEIKVQAVRQSDSITQEIILKTTDDDYCMFVARNWSRKDPAASNPPGYNGNFKALYSEATDGLSAADLECATEKNFKFSEYPGTAASYKAMLASHSPIRSMASGWSWTPFGPSRRYVSKAEFSGTWRTVFGTGTSLPPKDFSGGSFTNSVSDIGYQIWTGMLSNWHYMDTNTCDSNTGKSWENSDPGVSGSRGQTTTNSGAIYGINGDCSTPANLICVQTVK